MRSLGPSRSATAHAVTCSPAAQHLCDAHCLVFVRPPASEWRRQGLCGVVALLLVTERHANPMTANHSLERPL
jgi:hypothetical protein